MKIHNTLINTHTQKEKFIFKNTQTLFVSTKYINEVKRDSVHNGL